MHLFASAMQLAMHALRFGSMVKYRAWHSAMQDWRFASHPVCAAAWVGSTAIRTRMAEAKNRNKPVEWRISYGRI